MSTDALLIAGSMAALVVVSVATFFCSRRRPPRLSASHHDVELGLQGGRGGGIEEAVLATYPTLVFSSPSSPAHLLLVHGERKEETRDDDREEKEESKEEEEEEDDNRDEAENPRRSPSGDTAARCAVCQTDYADGDELRLLPECQHAFHRGCVDQWLRRRPTCPVCRASPPPPVAN